MGVVEMTAAQAAAIAGWAEDGEAFVALTLHTTRPSFATAWNAGDVLVTQGDAHLHIAPTGAVREAVPPFGPGSR